MSWLLLMSVYHFDPSIVAYSNDVCRSDVSVADIRPLGCGSCFGLCGRYAVGECACDIACTLHKDCCVDFEDQCPGIADNISLSPSEISCVTIIKSTHGEYGWTGATASIHMVSSCSREVAACEYNFDDAEHVLQYGGPVFQETHNITYVSAKCALCNGASVKDLQPFPAVMTCPDAKSNSHSPLNDEISNDSTTFVQWLRSSNAVCYISFSLHAANRICSAKTIDTCPGNCSNADLVALCAVSMTDHVMHAEGHLDDTYRNIYCALCNGMNLSQVRCGSSKRLATYPAGVFSLSLLFDLSQNFDMNVQINKVENDVNFFIPEATQSEEIDIGPTCNHLNHHCDQMTILSLVYAIDFLEHGNRADAFERNLRNKVLPSLLTAGDGDISFRSFNSTVVTQSWKCDASLKNSYITHFKSSSEEPLKGDTRYIICNKLTAMIGDMFAGALDQIYLQSIMQTLVLDNEMVSVFTSQCKMHSCTGVSLSWSDFQIRYQGLFPPECMSDIYQNDLSSKSASISVCIENKRQSVGKRIPDSLGYISISLSIVSVVCLAARLCLQKCNTSYHTKSGRMQFQLAISLILGNILLLVSPLAKNIQHLCAVLAILKHLLFISTFIWMTIISISAWRTFRRPRNLSKALVNSTLGMRFTILAWLFPALVTSVIYVLDFIIPDHPLSPGFGGDVCWFTKWLPLLFLFIIPVCGSIGVNIILYILVGVSLRGTFNDANNVDISAKRHQYTVYLKLFLLMGVTWSSLFLVTDYDGMWYIFVILNSSQGIYIFIAFVPGKIWLWEIIQTLRPHCDDRVTD